MKMRSLKYQFPVPSRQIWQTELTNPTLCPKPLCDLKECFYNEEFLEKGKAKNKTSGGVSQGLTTKN